MWRVGSGILAMLIIQVLTLLQLHAAVLCIILVIDDAFYASDRVHLILRYNVNGVMLESTYLVLFQLTLAHSASSLKRVRPIVLLALTTVTLSKSKHSRSLDEAPWITYTASLATKTI